MILALAYSNRDLNQAVKVMRWIGFLSSKNGNSMLNESVLLVGSNQASKYPRHNELCWLAARIFGESRSFVPDTEREVGWPGAANFMFSQALLHIEKHFQDDMFFLEPDGIPLVPTWWDQIKAEWEVAQQRGKCFLGQKVPHSATHMTGIAVYPANWREVAPGLTECPDHDAFDTFAAKWTLDKALFTPLIQHVFKRHDRGWRVPGLAILDPRAVLFHQDKKGDLIPMIDKARYGGEAENHPIFGYSELYRPTFAMTKFYYASNATKSHSAHGLRFVFSPVDMFAGAMPGVLTTDKEDEQIALEDLTSNPTTGIREISQEEWEKHAKKKWSHPSSNTSKPWNPSCPQAAIFPAPSGKSPAVLVAEPHSDPLAGNTPTGPSGIKDINDVIKTDHVVPTSTPPAKERPRGRPRKTTVVSSAATVGG